MVEEASGMFGRYFKSFDGEGWHGLVQGLIILTVTGLLVYKIFEQGHQIIGGLLAVLGVEVSFKFINRAILGSIYRHKDGKNKDLYESNKAYLDGRFKATGISGSKKGDKNA